MHARLYDPGMTHDPDRIRNLEESAAFADHSIEQLSEEILAVNQRLRTLVQRISALEGRLERLESPEDGPDPLERPPHAAGPED